MAIYEQLKEVLQNRIGEMVSPSEVKQALKSKYGINPSSVILSDYCYNRYNNSIVFQQHIFIYITRSMYKYVGENYPYTGFIFHKPKGEINETIVGEWGDGKLSFLHKPSDPSMSIIGMEQIKKLYEEYLEILRFEIHILNCKPTELRHLIGRLGEFFCAIYVNGTLAKETNQHGFDVLKGSRRISVKTTAQQSGFISVNKNTFEQFDDFFVVQYRNDDFHVLFYDTKDAIPLSRSYRNKYEINLSALKK